MPKIYTLMGYKPTERDENSDLNPDETLIEQPAVEAVYETDDPREAATGFVDGGLMDDQLWVTVEEVVVRDDAEKDSNTHTFVNTMQAVQKEKKARAEKVDDAISKND